MMIDVTVASDFAGDLGQIYTQMNPLAAGASLLRHQKDHAVFALPDGGRIVMTGTDLAWSAGQDGPVLTGGQVDALIYRHGRTDDVTFATLQTTGDRLWAAFEAEWDGTDPKAVVEILTHHCWTFRGSEMADLFPEVDQGAFGVPDLGGNDRIYLNGGDDDFFTGVARDSLYGGLGNDSLSGGTGNDLLIGGAGNDVLSGGGDDDALRGGVGQDWMMGGSGADRLEGGFGFDRLDGGALADVFVFDAGDGADVIVGYQVGIDGLDIARGIVREIVAQDGDALILLEGGSILVLGVAATDLTVEDFV